MMMKKDYSTYLEYLKGRRYDEVLKEPVLSESFYEYDYPDPLKYAFEAMHEIDPSYSYKLFSTVKRTQDLLTQRLSKRDYQVDARYQGPHNCDTHTTLYGDLELVILLKEHGNNPAKKVEGLVSEIMDILSSAHAYNKIDYSSRNRIHIQTRKPTCDLSILPAVWVDSSLYKNTGLEINRAICEFDFANKKRRIHLPFLNMARINSKDRELKGNLKALIRLLRNLVKDSEEPIELSFEEISGLLYNIPNKYLDVPKSKLLSVLPVISFQMKRLILKDAYRMKILAPSGKEYVFGKHPKKKAILLLKKELDLLIKNLMISLKEFDLTIKDDVEYL